GGGSRTARGGRPHRPAPLERRPAAVALVTPRRGARPLTPAGQILSEFVSRSGAAPAEQGRGGAAHGDRPAGERAASTLAGAAPGGPGGHGGRPVCGQSRAGLGTAALHGGGGLLGALPRRRGRGVPADVVRQVPGGAGPGTGRAGVH